MKLPAKLTKRRILVILICISVVTSLFGAPLAGRLRVYTQWAIAPLGDAGMYVTTTVQTGVGGRTAVTEEELRRLETVYKAYIEDLQAELSALKRQVPDMQRVYGRIPRSEFPYELIAARVVARDSLPYGSTGVVSFAGGRGVRGGARVTTRHLLTAELSKALQEELPALAVPTDRPAVADCVLVGRLMETWAFGASLQLVTDRGFRIQATAYRIIKDRNNPRMITIIEQGRARSEPLRDGVGGNNNPVPVVAEGRGDCLIAGGVSENDNVLPGDVLATVEDAFLPTPVLIGEVVKIEREVANPGRVTLRIRPAADLDKLRFVYVVAPIALRPES